MVEQERFRLVAVHRSRFSHYVDGDGQLTLCACTPWRFTGRAARRPLCDRCRREAIRLAAIDTARRDG